MPRPLWSGAISFGLVTIPAKIISATEDHSIHFRRVHLEDMGRVRTRKVCELDEKELSQEEIGKGYEVSKDEVVPVTDRELEEMPLPTAKAIEIVAFVEGEAREFVDSWREQVLNPRVVAGLGTAMWVGSPVSAGEAAAVRAVGMAGVQLGWLSTVR